MAKRRGVNVSAAIKAYIAENPDVGPKDAAEAISKQIGKKVPPTYVSNIKTTMKGKAKKKRGRKPGRKPTKGRETHGMNGSVDLVSLQELMTVVRKIGKDTARKLIDLL